MKCRMNVGVMCGAWSVGRGLWGLMCVGSMQCVEGCDVFLCCCLVRCLSALIFRVNIMMLRVKTDFPIILNAETIFLIFKT